MITFNGFGKCIIKTNDFSMELKVKKKVLPKKTARNAYKVFAEDNKKQLYEIVIAETEIQKYYLKREIDYKLEHCKMLEDEGFSINKPLLFLDGKYLIAVHSFYNELMCTYTENPLVLLKKIWDLNSIIIQNNDENISKIEKEYLDAWPKSFHERIKALKNFREFDECLHGIKTCKVCFEHGDFSPNNILTEYAGRIFLMDFEFAKKYQPEGFDIYYWTLLSNMSDLDEKKSEIPNYELNKIKLELCRDINDLLDTSIIYKSLLKRKVDMNYVLRDIEYYT